jgi:protein-S-isoprenylcysteine O-methyltransferase Ste14
MTGFVLALGYALGWVPMFWFRVEPHFASLAQYAGVERWAVRLAPAIVTLHVTAACLRLSFRPMPPPWRVAAGGCVFAAAIAFWFWARRRIGPLRSRRLPEEPPLEFTRSGAFAVVRHPLYFSYVVAAAAPVLATRSAPLLGTFALSFVAIAVRAVQEERRLRRQLGRPYDEYCAHVRRLIPFVW